MNLEKLFSAQKKLRERINYNGEDRFEKLILALLVEIGECANEWRGFKFWSEDQRARTLKWVQCRKCKGSKVSEDGSYTCVSCSGTGEVSTNPLLEEYVDGLHFVLELGIETENIPKRISLMREKTATDIFLTVMEKAIDFDLEPSYWNYCVLFERYIELGELLGFIWEQIEQAYFDKNQINHARQENGY